MFRRPTKQKELKSDKALCIFADANNKADADSQGNQVLLLWKGILSGISFWQLQHEYMVLVSNNTFFTMPVVETMELQMEFTT